MKKVNITYDVMVIENEEKIIGETRMDIEMMDSVADNLIATGQSGCALPQIEQILRLSEMMKGRTYYGNIKHIELAHPESEARND